MSIAEQSPKTISGVTSVDGGILSHTLAEPKAEISRYPLALRELAQTVTGPLNHAHESIIRKFEAMDWSTRFWRVDRRKDRAHAAEALSVGIPGFIEFGNFKALVFHPHEESMKTVNVAKGRKPDQVASVVTTREHIASLFDWSQLQGGLTREDVMRMVDTFYDRSDNNTYAAYAGPFGFRGPAADHIPDHLTSIDPETGLRTVQLIAPGYECSSNDIFRRTIGHLQANRNGERDLNYLAITSANPSSNKTGHDEPAHYRLDGIQQEFGVKGRYVPGFFIMGHKSGQEEAVIRAQYPHHEPNSTTILDFSRAERGEDGVISIHMARHGSLSDALTTHVVGNLGMQLVIDERARPNLPLRDYAELPETVLPRVAIIYQQVRNNLHIG